MTKSRDTQSRTWAGSQHSCDDGAAADCQAPAGYMREGATPLGTGHPFAEIGRHHQAIQIPF